ncbi:hypothetical protein [Mitsuokella multacida]|uniref:hypothetical protein n=1 Tax=Mitsuokella multacida TaxID=52226 RepID=UPI0026DCF9AF|nr:hypothetical protein [Mitsuokella multacida]
MKATISYGSLGGYALDVTDKITVTSWNELIEIAKHISFPDDAAEALLSLDDTKERYASIGVTLGGQVYDFWNDESIREEKEFREEVTWDMRFDDYGGADRTWNGYLLLEPQSDDGCIAVKLGDTVDKYRERRYTYRVPSYTVYEDGAVEENDWLYIEDDYVREYFERYRKG